MVPTTAAGPAPFVRPDQENVLLPRQRPLLWRQIRLRAVFTQEGARRARRVKKTICVGGEANPVTHADDTNALFRQAAAGDAVARDRLLQRHRERLRRMIAVRMDQRLKKRADPSDIVQETLTVADRRLEEYFKSQPIPFYPWLRQLACDQLITFHRKHLYASRRSRCREEDVATALSDESVAELASCLLDDRANPLSRLARRELQDRVRRAIDQLPEKYRDSRRKPTAHS
jgi:RNA polymerase sigma-70 factor (ECF subfamily)